MKTAKRVKYSESVNESNVGENEGNHGQMEPLP